MVLCLFIGKWYCNGMCIVLMLVCDVSWYDVDIDVVVDYDVDIFEGFYVDVYI